MKFKNKRERRRYHTERIRQKRLNDLYNYYGRSQTNINYWYRREYEILEPLWFIKKSQFGQLRNHHYFTNKYKDDWCLNGLIKKAKCANLEFKEQAIEEGFYTKYVDKYTHGVWD